MSGVITGINHVALRVRDVEAAVKTAEDLMGLRVVEEDGDRVYMTDGAPHHSLVYVEADTDAVDHIGLVASGPEVLAQLRERLEAAGHEVVSDTPLNAATEDGFAFAGPEGFVFEVACGHGRLEPSRRPRNSRASRFGHVTFTCADPAPMIRLCLEQLEFRLSDIVGEGGFMRCNVDHHGIGVFPGETQLHHYAWEVQSIVQMSELADLVDARGESMLWGPGRHGPGNNIATYYTEPCGMVVELYTDMQRIYDDTTFEPGNWVTEGHKWFSLWSPHVPDGFFDLGLPPAQLAKSS